LFVKIPSGRIVSRVQVELTAVKMRIYGSENPTAKFQFAATTPNDMLNSNIRETALLEITRKFHFEIFPLLFSSIPIQFLLTFRTGIALTVLSGFGSLPLVSVETKALGRRLLKLH
jgi:hypothetical protein